MKKLIYTFKILSGLIYLSPSEVMAQTVSTTEVDAKTQEKSQKRNL